MFPRLQPFVYIFPMCTLQNLGRYTSAILNRGTQTSILQTTIPHLQCIAHISLSTVQKWKCLPLCNQRLKVNPISVQTTSVYHTLLYTLITGVIGCSTRNSNPCRVWDPPQVSQGPLVLSDHYSHYFLPPHPLPGRALFLAH